MTGKLEVGGIGIRICLLGRQFEFGKQLGSGRVARSGDSESSSNNGSSIYERRGIDRRGRDSVVDVAYSDAN